MNVQAVLLVGLGGFFGAIARFGMGLFMRGQFGQFFPFATLVVNVLGCFAIGWTFDRFKEHPSFSPVALFAIVGFLGSFTTFSAFGLETVELWRNEQVRMAVLNILGNFGLCLLAVVVGGWCAGLLK